jgi:uncharacterized membrane protein (UPF0127 family)
MHRKQMKTNRGMLFIYEDQRERQTFYMKNTFIPLDLIYLNSELEIVDFNLDTKPLSEDYISSEIPSMFVLELNAGQVNQLTINKLYQRLIQIIILNYITQKDNVCYSY